MHIIRVYILRLFIDSESPDTLRGTVQAVPEGKPAAFQGEEALLAALRRADVENEGQETLKEHANVEDDK